MLTVSHISKSFDGRPVLCDVSLHVAPQTVFGLLGLNGAGKTTLIRVINRILPPDSGCVFFNGNPIAETDGSHLGYLPEERGLYRKMRVDEQLVYLARLKGLDRSDAKKNVADWMERLNIQEWASHKVCELSKGMQQKVQFIAAVAHNPSLLIVDEPFSGFDPVGADLLLHVLRRLRSEGTTIILSSHNMAYVEDLCDDVAILSHSHVVAASPLTSLLATYPNRHLHDIFVEIISKSSSGE